MALRLEDRLAFARDRVRQSTTVPNTSKNRALTEEGIEHGVFAVFYIADIITRHEYPMDIAKLPFDADTC